MKKKYQDEEFEYSCPECRGFKKTKRRDKKADKKYKNGDFDQEANMEDENSDNDQVMEENSEYYQMSNGKKSQSDGDNDSVQRSNGNISKQDSYSRKTSQKTSKKGETGKKIIKKKSRDNLYSGYKRKHDSLEQMMRHRSHMIAREREDIVDQRNLGSKVIQF